jgi:transcriptional regulator with XRE-family HTH domain
MRELAKRIRQARQDAGFRTIVAGAAHVRIAISTLDSYEKGTRSPGADNLRQIAKRYRISSDWLLGLPQARQ